MIALLVFSDGRQDYLQRTLASLEEHLHGPISHRILINDCLDEAHRTWLHETYPDFDIRSFDSKLGFAGAIQAGWQAVAGLDVEYVFHMENDFLILNDIDLNRMIDVLESDPHLAQLALLRQPWNEEEKTAGGIVQCHPEWYEQVAGYTKHKAFFTTNPCLYRISLTERGWPQEEFSEGKFSIALREDGFHFGFYQGDRFAPPKVHHIGEIRTGTGY